MSEYKTVARPIDKLDDSFSTYCETEKHRGEHRHASAGVAISGNDGTGITFSVCTGCLADINVIMERDILVP